MKRITCILVSLLLSASLFTACGSPASSSGETGGSAAGDSTAEGSAADPAAADPEEGAVPGDLREQELVKLDVVMCTTVEKGDAPQVMEEVNKILLDKLNVEMNLTYINYGNYLQQSTLMLSSGEGADLLPIYLTPLATCANNGQIIPLDDLLEQYGQEMVEAIGPHYVECGRVGDHIYGITTGRDLAKAYGIQMRKEICDEYEIDYQGIKDLDTLEAALYKVKESVPDIIPLVPSMGQLIRNWGWDTLGDDATSLGVLMDFGSELNVVNLYETDFYREFVTRTRRWYQDGVIMQDALSNTETTGTMMRSGAAFGGLANLKPGYEVQETRNNGIPICIAEIVPAYTTTADSQLATWAITSGCKNPVAAMKLMNVLYTDPDVVNLLIYGIEGTHYVAVGEANGDQKMIDYPEGIDAGNTGYNPGGGWLWCNQTVGHVWNGNPPDYWEVQTEFNNTAIRSQAFGFTFDSANVRNQVSACTNVVGKYHQALMCGTLDPETTLPVFIRELKDAGVDDIVAEKQAQLDAWAATK